MRKSLATSNTQGINLKSTTIPNGKNFINKWNKIDKIRNNKTGGSQLPTLEQIWYAESAVKPLKPIIGFSGFTTD